MANMTTPKKVGDINKNLRTFSLKKGKKPKTNKPIKTRKPKKS